MITGEYPIIQLRAANHDEGTNCLVPFIALCATVVAVPLAVIAVASGFLWRILLG